MNKDKRIDLLTRQMPILERVPRERRLVILNKALKHPLLWGSFVTLLIIWLLIFSNSIIAMGSIFDPGLGTIQNLTNVFNKLLVPVFIPLVVILIIILMIRRYLIEKIVKKEYLKG